jgi:hypothetical protein
MKRSVIPANNHHRMSQMKQSISTFRNTNPSPAHRWRGRRRLLRNKLHRYTGTTTWAAGTYKLGSQNAQDNTTWGTNRVSLASAVGWNEAQRNSSE